MCDALVVVGVVVVVVVVAMNIATCRRDCCLHRRCGRGSRSPVSSLLSLFQKCCVVSTIATIIISWSYGDGWWPLASMGWLRLPRCSSPCTPWPQTCS